ncbi:MAG: hypothetical protein KC620_22610, partial [Myxococcales bacterium]|nr:hypothetical protein [Myxococcales bacterium]
MRVAALALIVACALGCKVEFSDVAARFVVGDATWFEAEQTLFIFYEVQAEQGLSDASVVEVRFTTDDGVVDWTPVSDFESVHTHLAVDCGATSRCGSQSIRVAREPRDVRLRMRYHRDGALSLDATTRLNIVNAGPAFSHRSLLVYGVFTEDNKAVQWRARHHFPALRNEEVERLGLRRYFAIDDMAYGQLGDGIDTDANPYLYATDCEGSTPLEWQPVSTEERAIFSPETLPDAASALPVVCARSTVRDATGTFSTGAVARKNPEVRPAFPVLRSPVEDATPIKYVIATCDRTISTPHLKMQRQRLLIDDDVEPFCIDGLSTEMLIDQLVARIREDVERVRAEGHDMVLVMALHHDQRPLRETIEAALEEALSTELGRSTPRVVGAFVLDSYAYSITNGTVGATTIWCPASVSLTPPDEAILATAASLGCTLPPV